MNSCVVIDEWLSNVIDPISKKHVIPSKSWSDGSYIWDGSHVYFVKEYRARLPANFINHVKRQLERNFDPKSLNKEELIKEFQCLLQRFSDGDESIFENYT
jgi:hypothetical protein